MATTKPYHYDQVELVRVIDGDTVRLKISLSACIPVDFGFYVKQTVATSTSTELNFRLMGIDTPEIRGVPIEEKRLAVAAKDRITEMLESGKIEARTYKPDSFGRWLVELFVTPEGGEQFSVNQGLLDEGHAIVYRRKR